ncbi:13058_t:CDS:2 [Racocetra fulgida]|uniref:13058_t:CDS:1 n=1 Tax=Racocetra fulgida TaxID=60492 RepID=A0A9N9EXN4_9GLOM|nr:13058_t:CDS:2 [Racocetra fulgida]
MSSLRRQQSDDIRVVVGIGSFKTDTVLLYNSDCTEVLNWGGPALLHVPRKIKNNIKESGSPLPPQHRVIERFKLFQDDNASNKSNKLYLPRCLDYRKAISDYLSKMKGVSLKLSQVQFVLCVPAEWVNPDNFNTIELDLEAQCPSLLKYITGAQRTKLEKNEWLIELEFETVKKMFDPIIEKIIKLINNQLFEFTRKQVKHKCKAMFLVGGFSESQYLINRIREQFQRRVPIIASPRDPIAAIVRGAVKYGLNMGQVKSRVLKWTYGVEIMEDFDISNDPPDLRTDDNKIVKFKPLAYRGDDVKVDQTFDDVFKPLYDDQTVAEFRVYVTREIRPKYISNEMRVLGTLKIALSRTPSSGIRLIEFGLTFGKMEIKAMARNKFTGEIYHATFKYEV